MAEFAANSVLRVNWQFEVSDRICSFSHYYGQTLGVTPSVDAARQLVDTLETDVRPALRNILGSDTQIQGIYAHGVVKDQHVAASLHLKQVMGAVAGGSAPSNHACTFVLRSNDLPIRSQNRIYLCGLPYITTASATWDFSALGPELTAFLGGLQAHLTPSGGTHEFDPVARTTSMAVGASPANPKYFTVNEAAVFLTPAQQRRRNRKSVGMRQSGI